MHNARAQLRLANILAAIALALWLLSLPLTAYKLAGTRPSVPGLTVLMMGWLGPLSANFAWFANPAFLWALRGVWVGRPSVIAAVLSVLIALDTFRLDRVLTDEGGGTAALYGFGWGAVLWSLSLCVMLIATAVAEWAADGRRAATPLIRSRLFQASVALFALVLLAAGYHSLMDRARANVDERARLVDLAFKRWPVCAAAGPRLSTGPLALSGSVELRLERDPTGRSPIRGVETLIEWGVPVVRFEGRDYARFGDQARIDLTSTPSVAPAAAVLNVVGTRTGDAQALRIWLVNAQDQSTVLDHTWRLERNGAEFCPTMPSYAKAEDQPRKIVTEALSLRAPLVTTAAPRHARLKASARSVEYAQAAPAAPAVKPPLRGVRAIPSQWRGNRNCPADVGWAPMGGEPSPIDMEAGSPFMMGQTAWHLGRKDQYMAWCERDAVYLYQIWHGRQGTAIYIDARSLADFRQLWHRTIDLSGPPLGGGPWDVALAGVEARPGGVALTLKSEQSRTAVVAEFEMPPP